MISNKFWQKNCPKEDARSIFALAGRVWAQTSWPNFVALETDRIRLIECVYPFSIEHVDASAKAPINDQCAAYVVLFDCYRLLHVEVRSRLIRSCPAQQVCLCLRCFFNNCFWGGMGGVGWDGTLTHMFLMYVQMVTCGLGGNVDSYREGVEWVGWLTFMHTWDLHVVWGCILWFWLR